MKKYKLDDLRGNNNRQINAVYWQVGDESSDTIVCTFPGLSYPTEAPITFYQKLFFFDLGLDWVAFDYRYNENEEFMSMTDLEKDNYFKQEQKIFAEYINKKFKDKKIILLGKSLGTFAISEIMNHLDISNFNGKIQIILQTPTDTSFDIVNFIERYKIYTLVIIGNKDGQFFSKYRDSDLFKSEYVITKEIDGAGHLFEDYTHDLEKSINNLYKPIKFIEEYIKEDHVTKK